MSAASPTPVQVPICVKNSTLAATGQAAAVVGGSSVYRLSRQWPCGWTFRNQKTIPCAGKLRPLMPRKI